MKKYYILLPDGSSMFEQAYPEDFIFHCLFKLLDVSDERYRLLWFDEGCKLASVQLDSADVAVERITLTESEST